MSNDTGSTHGQSSWHEPHSEKPQQVAKAQWAQADTNNANILWESHIPALSEELISDEIQIEQESSNSAAQSRNLKPSDDANEIWVARKPESQDLAESRKHPIQPNPSDEKPQRPISQNWRWGRIATIPLSAYVLALPPAQRRSALNSLGAEVETSALQQAFGLNAAAVAIALRLRHGKSGTGVLGIEPDGSACQVHYCRRDTQWYVEFAQHWQNRQTQDQEEKNRQQAELSQRYIDRNQEAIDEWNDLYGGIVAQFTSSEQQQALEDFILQLNREPLWEGLTPGQAHRNRSTAKAIDLEMQIDGKLSVQAREGIFLDSLFWAYRQVQEIRYFRRSLTSKERNTLELLFADQPDPPDDSRQILSPAVQGKIDQWAAHEYQTITGQEQANPEGELWKTLQSVALMQEYPDIWNQVLTAFPARQTQSDTTVKHRQENLSIQTSSTQEDIAATELELGELQDKLVSAAIARLQANKLRLDSQARHYNQDLSADSRPWIELRSLAQQDRRLAQRHIELENQLASLAKENADIHLLSKDSNAETSDKAERLDPSAQKRIEEIQAQSEEMNVQIKLIEKTRRAMMCQFPAVGMIDTVKVAQAPNTPQINEEILETLSKEFSDIRSMIDDFQGQIAQDPSQAMRLTTGEMIETVLVPTAIALLEGTTTQDTTNDSLDSKTVDPAFNSTVINQTEATVYLAVSETVQVNLVLGQGNILLAGLDAGLSADEIEALGRLPILQGFSGFLSAADMTFLMRGLKAGLDGQMTAGLAAIRPLKQKLPDVHHDLTWLIRQAGKGGDMVYDAEGRGFQRSQPMEFIADRLGLLQDRIGLRKILDWVCDSACLDF
jgi:hypothetical protein